MCPILCHIAITSKHHIIALIDINLIMMKIQFYLPPWLSLRNVKRLRSRTLTVLNYCSWA